MNAIYIPQLTKAPQQTEELDVNEHLPGLETLTTVDGSMRITHRGNYLEVVAKAETIVTLTCDRCLQQYNYRLVLDTSELIWLDETANHPDELPLEREVSLDELVETLPPDGYFQPSEWLYEQLCLAIPQRQLCDQNCQGMQLGDTLPAPSPNVDRRWSSLEALRNQISNN